jgi:hypothetical protein
VRDRVLRNRWRFRCILTETRGEPTGMLGKRIERGFAGGTAPVMRKVHQREIWWGSGPAIDEQEHSLVG